MLVNRYNFLRWDDGQLPVTIESDLPTGYVQDPSRCEYMPLLTSAEAMRFYINTLDGLSFIPASGDTNTLNLVNAFTGDTEESNLATLQAHTFINDQGETVRTYYAEVVIDNTVPSGVYKFEVRDSESNVLLTSNNIQVIPSTSPLKQASGVCKFRHDRYFYGIPYHDLVGFYQQFRLHLNETDMQFEGDKEVYNEVTTGKQRTYNNFMKEMKKVETYFFDRHAHEAAAIMFDHEEFYINLKRYVPKGAYKTNYDPLSKVFKGEMELYVQEFATANRCAGVSASSSS